MKTYLGIDIGSTTSKAVLIDEEKQIVAKAILNAGTGTYGATEISRVLFREPEADRKNVAYTVVTGYGRKSYRNADEQMSELSCHAKGTHHLFPEVRTVIDIGGQDAKVIRLDERGRMREFVMNDKCAAGTGRFLDVMAAILKVRVEDLEFLAARSRESAKISSTCTVFAESEVISQLAAGTALPDLVAGICESVARRIGSQAKRLGVEERVCMSGGVAQNGAVRLAMERELGTEILTSPLSQYTGALGAALYAKARQETESNKEEQ